MTLQLPIRSVPKSNYYDRIVFKLNQPYTAKDGTVYNNYGSYLMQQYYRHPEYFRNSYWFTQQRVPRVLCLRTRR